MRHARLLVDDDWYGVYGAHLNSHTFVATIPNYESLHRADSADQILVDRAISHEGFHWRQYLGSTLGVFLLLGRWSQYGSLGHFLETCSDRERERFLTLRASGSPIVPLDDAGSLLFDTDNVGLKAAVASWHVGLVSERLIFDPESVLQVAVPYPLEYLVGDTFVDVVQGCPPIFGSDAETLYPNDRPLVTLDRRPFPRSPSGHLLSTRALMEGAATVNEFLLLRAARNVGGHQGLGAQSGAERAWAQLTGEGVYGDAVSEFCARCPATLDDFDGWVAWFLLCCDLALNPPVPPFASLISSLTRPIEWSSIYPPLRFQRAANVVGRLGRIDVMELPGHELELSQQLAELAGLVHWSEFDLQWRHDMGFRDVATRILESPTPQFDPSDRSGENLYLGYLGLCVKAFWAERLSDDGCFAAPALALLLDSKDQRMALHRTPPLITDHQGVRFWKPGNFGDPELLALAQTLLSIYLARDIFAGEGRLDVRSFPRNIATDDRIASSLIGLGIDPGLDLRLAALR